MKRCTVSYLRHFRSPPFHDQISSPLALQCCFSSSSTATSSRAISASSELESSYLETTVMLEQLTHRQPSAHPQWLRLQLHLPVEQPVMHLHPLNSRLTLSRIACIFLWVSQTTDSVPSETDQPCSVNGCRYMVFLSP